MPDRDLSADCPTCGMDGSAIGDLRSELAEARAEVERRATSGFVQTCTCDTTGGPTTCAMHGPYAPTTVTVYNSETTRADAAEADRDRLRDALEKVGARCAEELTLDPDWGQALVIAERAAIAAIVNAGLDGEGT